MARHRGMIRVNSFGEVTSGKFGLKTWLVNRSRRWAWGIVAAAAFAFAITLVLAIGQYKLAEITSPDVAMLSAKSLLLISQLILIGFISTLLWGMHAGSLTVMPTFSAEIPKFEPRPPPNLEAGETWEDWLRKGVRIGRWQGEVGSVEPGEIAWLQIVDAHPFIAAETRMGKSTVIWAILRELEPAIKAGVVEVVIFDPKNGQELAGAVALGLVKSTERMGRREDQVDQVDNFFYGQDVGHPDPNNPEKWIGKRYEETFVVPLEREVETMRKRASEARAAGMQVIPASTKYKRRIVIVDEGASLVRPGAKPETKGRIVGAMLSLCDQGASSGWTVITATQHPDMRKVPWRHGLVGDHLCGLVKTWDAVDMVLGRGSYARGAWGDQLNPRIPGVFFMSRHGAFQLRVQNAKPTFKKKPPDRGGGGKEIERPADPEPTNEELARVIPLRAQQHQIWPREHEHVGGEQTGTG